MGHFLSRLISMLFSYDWGSSASRRRSAIPSQAATARRRLEAERRDVSEGELAIRRDLAPQTCIRSIHKDRNHDAVMRIGGEAPGGGPILLVGISAMFVLRFPPPRILNSAAREKPARAPKWC